MNRYEENYEQSINLIAPIFLVGGLSSCHSGDVTIGGTKPITPLKWGSNIMKETISFGI